MAKHIPGAKAHKETLGKELRTLSSALLLSTTLLSVIGSWSGLVVVVSFQYLLPYRRHRLVDASQGRKWGTATTRRVRGGVWTGLGGLVLDVCSV